MFCKKCGHELKDGVSFCNYCGEKVTFKPEAPLFDAEDGFAKSEPVSPAPQVADTNDVYSSAPVNNVPDYNNGAPQTNYNAPIMPNNNAYTQPAPQVQPQTQYVVTQAPAQEPFTPPYKPISAWGYFGYNLLFAIPLVGFICLIIFSLSNENINRRNYARSFWCWLVIAVVIGLVFGLIGLVTGGAIFSELEYMF